MASEFASDHCAVSHGFARIGPTPNGDRQLLLKNHVVGENLRQTDVGARGGRKRQKEQAGTDKDVFSHVEFASLLPRLTFSSPAATGQGSASVLLRIFRRRSDNRVEIRRQLARLRAGERFVFDDQHLTRLCRRRMQDSIAGVPGVAFGVDLSGQHAF